MNLNIPSKYFLGLILSIVLVEIFLGGGGRLLDVGSLSIRMVVFIILLAYYFFFAKKIFLNRNFLEVITLGLLTFLIAIFVGLLNKNPIESILTDVKPLIYLLSIVYFSQLIRNNNQVNLIISLLKKASLFLALTYIIIFMLINTNLISFRNFYNWASSTEEFFFRGEFAFFYKGFLYLCIGLFCFNWKDGFYARIAIILILTAMLLTFTRGFILSAFIVYLVHITFIKKKIGRLMIILIIGIFAASTIWAYVSNSSKIDRKTSDSARIEQISEVFNNVDLISVLFGRGFGQNISSREDLHLEISYLEIFYKQGLFGLFFWFFFIASIFFHYRNAARVDRNKSEAFLLASLFTIILSFTNPFINNPIGMTVLILSMICLKRISQPILTQGQNDSIALYK